MAEKEKRRGPRKATARYLENKAVFYLARFSASRESLRRVLMRAVQQSAKHHGTDPEAGVRDIDALLDKLTGLGSLDDAAYAESRARALRQRGLSARAVRGRLLEKGIDGDLAGGALAKADLEVGGELAAAARLARRRGLGPYRRTGEGEKDLATLARAGFSYHVARKVIESATPQELDDRIAEEQ